jgi:hypothetical protein
MGKKSMSVPSTGTGPAPGPAPAGADTLDSLGLNDELKAAISTAKTEGKTEYIETQINGTTVIDVTIKNQEEQDNGTKKDVEYTLRIEIDQSGKPIFKIKVKDEGSDEEYFVAIFHYNPEERMSARSYVQINTIDDCRNAQNNALKLVAAAIKAQKVARSSQTFCEKGPITIYEDGSYTYEGRTINTEIDIKRLRERGQGRTATNYGAQIEVIKNIFAEIKGVFKPPDRIAIPSIRGPGGSRMIADIGSSTAAIQAIIEKVQQKEKATEIKGIPNKGNTCWMASLMQMIMSTDGIKEAILGQKSDDFKPLKLAIQKIEKSEELKKDDVKELENCIVALCKTDKGTSGVKKDQQNDPHEALMGIVGKLEVEKTTVTRTATYELAYSKGTKNSNSTETQEIPLIELVLSGKGDLKLQALIDGALTDESEKEIGDYELDGPGKAKTRATPTKIVKEYPKAPKELVIYPKRFSGNAKSKRKIHTPIEVPLKYLVLKKENINRATSDTNYQLKSFIVHKGDMSSDGTSKGHYISVVKKGDKWYLCDDANVHEMKTDQVKELAKHAYMLTYELDRMTELEDS